MKCKGYCYAASAFLMGSLYLMLKKNNSSQKNNLIKLLNDEQKTIYNNIKMDRFRIYMKAKMGGLITALIFYLFNKENNNNSVYDSCIYTFIFFITQYFIYSLHPKQDWMIKHLTDSNQVDAWLENYRFMKDNWHRGLVLGIFSFALFSYVFIENKGFMKVNEFITEN